MIISKAPLRISLFGGGTDLKHFYKKNGSKFVSLAIDKYVYSIINEPFENKYFLKYRKNEEVFNISEIKNELLKEILLSAGIKDPIEISSFADIPFGTGLGSSGAYIVSMLKSLNNYQGSIDQKHKLAKLASEIEVSHFDNDIVGLQDTYVSAFGGLKKYVIDKKGNVNVHNLLSEDRVNKFTEKINIYFTNKTRKSSNQKSKLDEKQNQINLNKVAKIADQGVKALIDNDEKKIGELMNEQWLLKLQRQPSLFHKNINKHLLTLKDKGALGGKLIGAGGGGFILVFSNKNKIPVIDEYMNANQFRKVKFKPDHNGTRSLII